MSFFHSSYFQSSGVPGFEVRVVSSVGLGPVFFRPDSPCLSRAARDRALTGKAYGAVLVREGFLVSQPLFLCFSFLAHRWQYFRTRVDGLWCV